MENKLSIEASIGYLKTVLGIDSFILPLQIANADFVSDVALGPESESHLVAEGPEDAALAIVVETTVVNDETYALLERMIAAMKQSISTSLLIQLGENSTTDEAMGLLAKHPRRAVVIFGSRTGELLSGGKKLATAQWLAPLPTLPVIVTHGLEEIQKSPELKKVVWQHLQMTMQRLG